MDPARLSKVRSVFDTLIESAPESREARLEQLCAGDPDLRAEVRALLEVQRGAGGFLNTPAAATRQVAELLEPAPDGRVGTTLGQYHLEAVLGEGGMGVVYRARQDRPRRSVALKLIGSPFVSPGLLRRFEHEAQILARLKHPGIAQVFDAGSIPDDRGRPQPFFAMELVEGPPLLHFASQQHLSTRQRLELFTQVCDAVEHAHQKGVIHRDLKPANILVEAAPGARDPSAAGSGARPKILDFGVARATDADIAVTTMQTGVGQVIGTLQYMSPEQVRGEVDRIDTRSDVYALGVILFELLTGRLPYDLRNRSLAEAARVIGEDEPTRLSIVERTLRGDVETIVAKALEKDPARRYASASALAADVRRFLGDLPIVARPPSTSYQLRKFARRNRALVAGVIATILALAAGIVGTGIGLYRATQERTLAQRREAIAKVEARKATRAVEFLVRMLTAADPDATAGREVTVRQTLDAAAADLGADLKDEPDVQLAVETAVARTYRAIGDSAKAGAHLDAAEALAARLHGASSPEATALLLERARLEQDLHDWVASEATCRRALALAEAHDPPDAARIGDLCATLAGALSSTAQLAEAQEMAQRALDLAQAGGDADRLAGASGVLAGVIERIGGPDWTAHVERLRRLEVQTLQARYGRAHSGTVRALSNLAYFLGNQGKDAEAVPLMEEVVGAFGTLYGEQDRRTLGALTNLATSLQDVGELARAEGFTRRAIDGLTAIAPDSAELASALHRHGAIIHRQRRYADAEPPLREAVRIRRARQDPNVVSSLSMLGGALQRQGRLDAAAEAMGEAIAIRRAMGTLMIDFGILLNNYADILAQAGKDAEAERLFRESIAFDREHRPGNRGLALNLRTFGQFLHQRARSGEAEPLMKEAYDLVREQPAAQRRGIVELYAAVLKAVGKAERAGAITADLEPEPGK